MKGNQMNYLVKQLADDDGYPVPRKEQRWHLVVMHGGSDPAMLCTGEFIDSPGASGNGEEYIRKESKRGITCEKCRGIIKEMKVVKL